MMETKLIFLSICAFFSISLSAQQTEEQTVFAPIGAKWYYKIQLGNSAPDWYYRTFEAIKDTIIEEKKCVVLEQTEYYSIEKPYIAGYEYFYKEGQKVYRWEKWSKEFTLLYDFSTKVSDSWEIPCTYCWQEGYEGYVTMRVEEISYIEYSGLTLKLLKIVSEPRSLFSFGFKYFNGSYGQFITERMGGGGYLFLYGYSYDDMYIPQFYCYSDNETKEPCDIALGISNPSPNQEQSVLIISNDYVQLPTSLQLKTDIAVFYDMNGKVVLSEKVDGNRKISVSILFAGIYLLRIETNEGIKTYKISKS